ncbi:MAG: di-trans,poly-cis-decaprenylcistransferase [Dehalococcoidales bacterium]|jgi:undecaprenyl diphosphate synthase|nr:di-trans,poly-cis-decaprenylcistransferase [Dehalococcoidales bacterium]
MAVSSSSQEKKFALLPAHIAIIPDGNGRWAEKRGLPRSEGHRNGTDNMYRMVEYLSEYNVPYLTLFGFSTENWRRPEEEVYGLFSILTDFLERVIPDIQKKGIRINHIGRLEGLPEDFQASITDAVESTRHNPGVTLNIAFNYGGKAEIVDAVKRIIDDGIPSDDISEDLIERYLYTVGIPPVDLLIRTSNESRLSNFLIWQSSYSEIYFSDVLWPDFGKEDIDKALEFYNSRKRRFGGL